MPWPTRASDRNALIIGQCPSIHSAMLRPHTCTAGRGSVSETIGPMRARYTVRSMHSHSEAALTNSQKIPSTSYTKPSDPNTLQFQPSRDRRPSRQPRPKSKRSLRSIATGRSRPDHLCLRIAILLAQHRMLSAKTATRCSDLRTKTPWTLIWMRRSTVVEVAIGTSAIFVR